MTAADKDCIYWRARIERLITREVKEVKGLEQITGAEVFLIDLGVRVDVGVGDLAHLPEDVLEDEVPPCASRVVVSGVLPADRDTDWGHSTSFSLLGLMELESQIER